MMNSLHVYVLQYAKRHLSSEVTSNSGKLKHAVLAVIELCLSEGICQSVSQLKISLNYF